MKVVNAILGIMMLLGFVLVPATPVSAMSLSLTSCMQVQNLEAGQAAVTMSFYAQTVGVAPIDVPATIEGNSSKTFCNLAELPAGFNGSAVISSSTRLAVIANLTNPTFTGMMASYRGFDSGSTTVNIPLAKKNDYGYSTQFTVQNVGAGTTVVSVTYTDGITASQSIEAGRSFTFDQSTEAHVDPAGNTGWVGGATITSTPEPIVVVNLESNNSVLFAYNGLATTDATFKPIFPLVQANWYTYFTGIAILNTTSTPTKVTMNYTATQAGTSCAQTLDIPGNKMVAFAVNAWAANDTDVDNNCKNGEGFVGMAQVTTNSANVPLVGIVNELSISKAKGGAYTGFNPAAGTTTVLFPLITDHNYGFFSGFGLVNVGDTPVDVTCTYTPTAVGKASLTQSTTNLAMGGAWTQQQLNLFIAEKPSGYVGGGTCVAVKTPGSTGGTSPKIVGVLNYLKDGTTTDTLSVSEGINQ
jgi:hypothetical protein